MVENRIALEETHKILRDGLLQIINGLELLMGISPTTSELRKRWRGEKYSEESQVEQGPGVEHRGSK